MPSPSRPLALITGASSGIGQAIAQDLATTHTVIAWGRNKKRLDQLGSSVVTMSVDLQDDDAVAHAISQLTDKGLDTLAHIHGSSTIDHLDVIIHSAGCEVGGRVDNVETITPERWRSALNLNVIAPAYLTQLVLPLLRACHGQTIFINSGAGLHAWPEQSVYCASKYALRAFADSLRLEEQGKIRVATLYPGRVNTPMQERIQRDYLQRDYNPDEHMDVISVVKALRLMVDMGFDACVEDLSLRPSQLS
ncbi:SDR family oxidoreductase [Actinomyces vulturis]|uniref:SDR family oxidoreductase n=1 Tax=Actinomyces vulturis TaxID=1857645 RepID=UPI0008341119|nr:SDR family oxidoreductase [Actinomyces vulturis]